MSRANTYRLVALASSLSSVAGRVFDVGEFTMVRPDRTAERPRSRVDLSRPEVRRAIPGAARLGARRLRRLRNQAARGVRS